MKVIVIVFLCLFLPFKVHAEEKIVTLATLTDFAPFCFKKENSPQLNKEIIKPGSDSVRLQGYSWDIVRESYQAQGYTIELYIVPWARGLHYLDNGMVEAIFPANRTEKREQTYQFSNRYVDRTKMVVYVPVDSSIRWQNLSSLNGLNVGVVRAWAYGKKWEGNTKIKKEIIDTIFQGFQILENKRLDAVVGYEIPYDYVLRNHGLGKKFKKIGYFGIVDEYMMIKKNDASAKEKIDAFDRGHMILEQSGRLGEISDKWK